MNNNITIKGKQFRQSTYNGYISLVNALNEHSTIEKPFKIFAGLAKQYSDIDISIADFTRIIARLVSYSKQKGNDTATINIMSISTYRNMVTNKDSILSNVISATVTSKQGNDPFKADRIKAEKQALKQRKKEFWDSVKVVDADTFEKYLKALNPFIA